VVRWPGVVDLVAVRAVVPLHVAVGTIAVMLIAVMRPGQAGLAADEAIEIGNG
jgi:hypothetical protein